MKSLKLFSLLAIVSIGNPLLGMSSRLRTPWSRTQQMLSAAALPKNSLRSFGSWRERFERFMWGQTAAEARHEKQVKEQVKHNQAYEHHAQKLVASLSVREILYPVYHNALRQKEGLPAKYAHDYKNKDVNNNCRIARAKVKDGELTKKLNLDGDWLISNLQLQENFRKAHQTAEEQIKAAYAGTEEDLVSRLKEDGTPFEQKPLALHLSPDVSYAAVEQFLRKPSK